MPDQTKPAKAGRRSLLRIIFSRTAFITLLLLLHFFYLFSIIFDLFRFVPLLFGSMVVFTAVMELVILNSAHDPDVKLSWAVLVAVLPLLGAFLYFFVRLDLGNQMSRRFINTSIHRSLDFLPPDPALYETIRADEPDLYPMARYLADHAHAPAFTDTEVTYYPTGEAFFADLLTELERAEHFIFLEYFLVSEGHMWNSILEILRQKAAAGVDVRFLYDGMNAYTNLPYHYPKLLQKAGIRCKMHAPVRPFVSTHYNNRDHRKIAVIDGHTAFTGGINLEDCYININSPYGHWKDTAVRLQGDGAQGLTLLFLQLWNSTEREPAFLPHMAPVDHPFRSGGFVIPYGDGPYTRENIGESVYLNLINQAKERLYIMTPYLIPDVQMIEALKFAAKRGVEVHLILPGIPDKKTVQIMARSFYGELIESGVKIYEYTSGFIHAKVFLCDSLRAVVGTINLDYRSLRHHFECGVYLYRLPVLEDIREDFCRTLELCHPVSAEDLRCFSPFSRLYAYLTKLLAPLL